MYMTEMGYSTLNQQFQLKQDCNLIFIIFNLYNNNDESGGTEYFNLYFYFITLFLPENYTYL